MTVNNPNDLPEVDVDFRSVDPQGMVWTDAGELMPGTEVLAVDASGNRCVARVSDIDNGRACLDLILETFRDTTDTDG